MPLLSRGPKLRAKLESYLQQGHIHTIIYSNPNNPSWICFTEEELQIIGELANQYDVFVLEDLAYFGMDFRHNISTPGVPPFQPSVGKYTDNYALMISGSKAFSYAGERIALLILSNCYVLAKDGDDGYINARFSFTRVKQPGSSYKHAAGGWPKWERTDVIPMEDYVQMSK